MFKDKTTRYKKYTITVLGKKNLDKRLTAKGQWPSEYYVPGRVIRNVLVRYIDKHTGTRQEHDFATVDDAKAFIDTLPQR